MKTGALSIDMGSCNTTIFQAGQGIVLHEPSMVTFTDEENRHVRETGTEAKKLVGKASGGTHIVSPIFEGSIVDYKAAQAMLEIFLNKVTVRKLGARPKVVCAVPCGADRGCVKTYEKLLLSCGVSDYSLVESPILAALGLQNGLSEPQFIINIGGTTTEIAAVSGDGVICGVSVNMGGVAIDNMIRDKMENEFNLLIGSRAAEHLKIAIGSLLDGDCNEARVSGKETRSGIPRSRIVSAADIADPIRKFFDGVLKVAEMLLGKLTAEVAADIRKNGVSLVGGTANIQGLDDYVRRRLELRGKVAQNPQSCTAIGGGILSDDKQLIKRLAINGR